MSHSNDPTDPTVPEVADATRHELHWRGRAYGLEYDIGIRVRELSEAALEAGHAPLLPHEPRPALPAGREDAGAPEPEGDLE